MNNPLQPLHQPRAEADLANKILRGMNDTVRVLDDVRGRAQTVPHLFTPHARVLRSKLHDLCSRYIWTDPKVNGRRGEETLWKKAYHDVFVTAKRLKKEGSEWDEEESSLMRGLLLSGVGYYQHFIFRLQADYYLNIKGIIDFSMTISDDGLSKGKTSGGRCEETMWADEMVGHCLLYMGDLSRYLREFDPGWDLAVSERYYTQAAWLSSANGRPYNQLGTLVANRNYSLDAVYYYMRSMSCSIPFPGAESNLGKVLEKNWNGLELEPLGPLPTSLAQRTITRFLVLIDVWFCGRHHENLHISCSEVVDGFQQLLRPAPIVPHIAKNASELAAFTRQELTNNLSSPVALFMFSTLFMCWEKLKATESVHEKALTATLLAMMDAVMQQIVERESAWRTMRKKQQARRRRRRRHNSDASSSGESESESGAESPGDSPHVSSDEELLIGDDDHASGSWVTDGLLPIMLIMCLWLEQNKEVVAKCQSSVKPFSLNMVHILNKLRPFITDTHAMNLEKNKTPLPEDALLRDTPGLRHHHAQLDWTSTRARLPRHKEVLLRVSRVVQCGEGVPGVRRDAGTRVFHMAEVVDTPAAESPSQEGKGKLMKNMGELWLKAEVKELENRVKRVNGDYSPYLVVDVDALTDHVTLIKQLVGSRHFIVVIPSVVLTQLDECKKTSGKARESIRWLESQFLHGNRNLRSQKAQERLPLGVIKYPKKKDKEAWNFFQIMECCSYFSKQSELRSKGGATVTCLTGSKDKDKSDVKPATNNSQDFSPSGLAMTCGVTLEHVETFHSKWKLSTKSRG